MNTRNEPTSNWSMTRSTVRGGGQQRTRLPLICACLIIATAAHAWNPLIPTSTFQEMSVFERAQYQKAEQLFKNKQYALAANEFDKFALQFQDSEFVPAMVFLKAYSLLQGLKRNTAIQGFKEVVDFFPDDVNYAGAAMYYIGDAHMLNGDTRAGLRAWKELVNTEAYQQHTLVAPALKALANNAYKNKDRTTGHRYMQQIYANFYSTNRKEAIAARDSLAYSWILDNTPEKIESVVALHDWKEPGNAVEYYNYIDGIANAVLKRYFNDRPLKERTQTARTFYDYWSQSRSTYEANNAISAWLQRAFTFTLTWLNDKSRWEPLCNEYVATINDESQLKDVMVALINHGHVPTAMKLAERLKTDGPLKAIIASLIASGKVDIAMPLQSKVKNKQAFYPWLFDQLLSKNETAVARPVVDKIDDPALRKWTLYRWHAAMNHWQDCITILQAIAANDEQRNTDASWALAGIYQNRTRQYDEAIKIYTVLNSPPKSVWPIAECYKAKGEMEKAASSYREIENFFPEAAPQAANLRAALYAYFGSNKKAIAEYRRILKVYPKSKEASIAHQRLEDLGVATGGGETR